MTKNEIIKHHITGVEIAGYGIAHLINNYNNHTMNQTTERDAKHFIPSTFQSKSEIIDYFAPKPVVEVVKPVEKVVEKPKNVVKKVVKKAPAKKKRSLFGRK